MKENTKKYTSLGVSCDYCYLFLSVSSFSLVFYALLFLYTVNFHIVWLIDSPIHPSDRAVKAHRTLAHFCLCLAQLSSWILHLLFC